MRQADRSKPTAGRRATGLAILALCAALAGCATSGALTKGRNGAMPAWEAFLGKDKIQLVSGYVYSLSHQAK